MSHPPESVDFVALSLLPISSWRHAAAYLRAGEPPQHILERVIRERPPVPPVDPPALRSRAAAALARAKDRHIVLVPWSDASYPAALSAIVDPPPALWVRGNLAALAKPAVAVVGSRAGSPYALTVAERLSAELAARGVVVVSGLARGVDSAAHRGALAANGSTLAVLGSVRTSIRRARLARAIEPTAPCSASCCPARRCEALLPAANRIISGLACRPDRRSRREGDRS